MTNFEGPHTYRLRQPHYDYFVLCVFLYWVNFNLPGGFFCSQTADKPLATCKPSGAVWHFVWSEQRLNKLQSEGSAVARLRSTNDQRRSNHRQSCQIGRERVCPCACLIWDMHGAKGEPAQDDDHCASSFIKWFMRSGSQDVIRPSQQETHVEFLTS